MDVNALFDKLVIDLADAGVSEARGEGGARLLVRDGIPFARLGGDERMAFRSLGDPGVHAQVGQMHAAEDHGDWVVVAADDVAAWEGLARRALAAV